MDYYSTPIQEARKRKRQERIKDYNADYNLMVKLTENLIQDKKAKEHGKHLNTDWRKRLCTIGLHKMRMCMKTYGLQHGIRIRMCIRPGCYHTHRRIFEASGVGCP
jgi:hypothetical protein